LLESSGLGVGAPKIEVYVKGFASGFSAGSLTFAVSFTLSIYL
jgi:hypothetical protein